MKTASRIPAPAAPIAATTAKAMAHIASPDRGALLPSPALTTVGAVAASGVMTVGSGVSVTAGSGVTIGVAEADAVADGVADGVAAADADTAGAATVPPPGVAGGVAGVVGTEGFTQLPASIVVDPE